MKPKKAKSGFTSSDQRRAYTSGYQTPIEERGDIDRLLAAVAAGCRYFWTHPDKPWRHGLERV